MTRLEKTEKITSIIQAVVTVIAIILAGIWFYLQRELRPKLNITHTVTYQPITEHWNWIHIDVGLTNISKRHLRLTRGRIRIQQILPLDDPLAEAINRGENLIPQEQTQVTWPMLGNTYSPNLQIRMEPGESDTLEYEFIVPSSLKVVRIYTYFEEREGAEWGWSRATIYELKREGG
jgi:hypothetical protein